jgi:hypothetical protein
MPRWARSCRCEEAGFLSAIAGYGSLSGAVKTEPVFYPWL